MATKVFDLETAEALILGTATAPCPKCGESNWTKANPRAQTSKPGMLTVRCKVCANKASSACKKARYANDPVYCEAQKARKKERYANDEEFREAEKVRKSAWYANDTDEAYREAQKASSLQWQKDNPGKRNAKNAKYRATKKQATPPWSETDLIQEFYVNCPEGMHVDHIYPLVSPLDENGKEIGNGLHVLKNLQYLTAAENISKSNKWPESLVDWTYTQS